MVSPPPWKGWAPRLDEEPQSRPSRDWRKNFCSPILCARVAELSRGVELHHLHHLHLQTLRALQGSRRQPSRSAHGHTNNSKNKNPIACCKQTPTDGITLWTETTLKQGQQNTHSNGPSSYIVREIPAPEILMGHKEAAQHCLTQPFRQSLSSACATAIRFPRSWDPLGLSRCLPNTPTAAPATLGTTAAFRNIYPCSCSLSCFAACFKAQSCRLEIPGFKCFTLHQNLNVSSSSREVKLASALAFWLRTRVMTDFRSRICQNLFKSPLNCYLNENVMKNRNDNFFLCFIIG